MAGTRDLVQAHFDRVVQNPAGTLELKQYNKVFQFRVQGEEPYVMRIQDGRVQVSVGEEPAANVILETDAEGLRQVVAENKIIETWRNTDRLDIFGFRRDRHTIAWFCRLVRLGHGDTDFVPGIKARLGV